MGNAVKAELAGKFEIDESIVSTIPGLDLDTGTSQERYRAWRQWLRDQGVRTPKEFLVPRIVVNDIQREWPDWMTVRPEITETPNDLVVRALELGAWIQPFKLGGGVMTNKYELAHSRILFRRELISRTVAEVLGDDISSTTVLDIGCHSGFFSFDIAARGAKHVDGVDLRDINIQQANFLKDIYGFENVTFTCADATELPTTQWDVVMNLGVIYHLTDPLSFLTKTYEMTRNFTVIDTVCDIDPVSSYTFLANKDVSNSAEGREEVEVHPTYRATIELIRLAGFKDVTEIVGDADPPHDFYEGGMKRAFLAWK